VQLLPVTQRNTAEIVDRLIAYLADVGPANGYFYAASYPGATDDARAQAALTACYAAGGGTVVLPAGTLTWAVAPLQLLPNGIRVKVQGAPLGTKVVLTAGCPRFADFARSADGDTFTDIAVEDLLVDANSVGGKHHVILGNCIGFAAGPATKVNLNRISVRRVRAINVPVGTDDAVDLRVGVAIQSWNNGDTPDAQNTISDVVIEDVHVEGGKVGFQVAGFPLGGGVTSANVWVDGVYINRCSHICAVPTQFGAGNHVIIGNKGWGGIARLSNFKGVGCSDCGIEVNAIQDFVGTNIYVEDAWNHAYYNQNYHAPSNASTQLHRYNKCSAQRTSSMTNASSNGVHYATKSAGGSYPANIDIDGFRWVDGATTFNGGGGDGIHIEGPLRQTVRDFLGYRDFGTYSGGTAVTTAMVWCDSLDTSQNPSRVTMDNVRCKIIGTKSGSGAVTNYAIRVGKVGITDFRLLNCEADFVVTSAIAYGITVGDSGSVPTVRGTIDKASFATNGSSSTSGIRIHGSGTTTITGAVTIIDPDFSRMQSSATEIDFQGTSNAAKVHVIRPRWRTAKTPSAISPGASPYSYQNLDGYSERVIVRGGTVSLIELAADNTNFEDTGVTAGAFLVEPGATLKVTYSSAPTMRKIPPVATAVA